MDYETPDGSQFSLREVWHERNGDSKFAYTSVSAYVDGSAYAGRLDVLLDEVDDASVMACLTPVPPEHIRPLAPPGLTIAPEFDSAKHYLKAPSFTWEDCQPGKTLVADCVLNEVDVLELLKLNPHPHIATYFGCVVKDGRITHICLEKYPSSLGAEAYRGFDDDDLRNILWGVQYGLDHLFNLRLAHNDINPGNVCLDAEGNPIIIDFDACLPFDKPLMKGTSKVTDPESGAPLSSLDNDMAGVDLIEEFMENHRKVSPHGTNDEERQTGNAAT